MFEGKETPDEIIQLVAKKIYELKGLDKAFRHNKHILLYSGPSELYDGKFIGSKRRNGKRAAKQAKEKDWPATLLDDTPIGKFLFVENRLYDWFEGIHASTSKTKDELDAAVARDAKIVMTYVSALFIRAASGAVKTAVCGASRERVFYETEIPGLCDRNAFPEEARMLVRELLENRDIKTINGVSISDFRSVYLNKGLESVYDRICRTELQERCRHAYQTRNPRDYVDYLDRLELYCVDKTEYVFRNKPNKLWPKAYREATQPFADRRAAKLKRFMHFRHSQQPTNTSPSPSKPPAAKTTLLTPNTNMLKIS